MFDKGIDKWLDAVGESGNDDSKTRGSKYL
jgi:hypothetical protein